MKIKIGRKCFNITIEEFNKSPTVSLMFKAMNLTCPFTGLSFSQLYIGTSYVDTQAICI